MGKILVVDDEKEIRNMLKEFLTRKNYQVALADSGTKALEIIDKNN
ncbi:MAG: response regulator, partial [Candidatus Omnitrophica bacterium]|nr:response regulator [Candidatus Omnitrophota bacterium]